MLVNNAVFKYETPYKGPFLMINCWTYYAASLKWGVVKIGIIYIALNHIHLIQKLKIINIETYVW